MSIVSASSQPHLFGWVPPSSRDESVVDQCANIVASMPPFTIVGAWAAQGSKAVLWEFTKSFRKGKHLPALYQSVGSCVGHGGCKAEWYLEHIQIVKLGRKEIPKLPYEPFGYAQSRVCAGISGNEDGSTGSGMAQAAKQYGVLRADFPGLPAHMVEDGSTTLKTPGQIDRQWGTNGAPKSFQAPAHYHLVKTVAPVRTPNDVAAALQNGYPVTIASDWGGIERPDTTCPLEGNPQVRLNQHASQWPHQMMVSGWWQHPSLGEIFHIDNSWGASAHGDNPDDAPPGGFWIKTADMAYIVRQNDSFAYSDEMGFPAAANNIIPWIFA